ncbi:Phosphomevalonate kinase [Phellopilus nigrolimitatus]|nr:Phosphomevalonate kinase [Phellopilus nigrolimitatus]
MSTEQEQGASPTVVSAPGKVLIAGGYLVLDQKYSGVVVSTSSRFYTAIRSGSEKGIRVRSPQFENASWEYDVSVNGGEEEEGDVRVSQRDGAQTNRFVYVALQQTLRLACEITGAAHLDSALARGLDVTIVGANDFYSQRAKLAELGLEPRIASLAQIPPFAYTGVSLKDVHKTGLGSSAALITSLVGALLLHLTAIPSTALDASDTAGSGGRALTHAAAQLAHCLAQGKVGSGFDVAAASFGSQIYTRFSPRVLAPLMSDDAGGAKKPSLRTALAPANADWDHTVAPFQLPPATRLMLADVDAGSDTPSLVGRVLKWRQSACAEATALWDALAASNDALAKALLRLSELHAQDAQTYTVAFARLAQLPAAQWSSITPRDVVTDMLIDAHRLAEDVRAKMREMGARAGVPIEPPEQTALLDACVAQAGVLGGGVPGAGGYDAVWVLVLDPGASSNAANITEETPLRRVENVWAGWSALDVSPLSATESFARGLRRERVQDVPGLEEALNV